MFSQLRNRLLQSKISKGAFKHVRVCKEMHEEKDDAHVECKEQRTRMTQQEQVNDAPPERTKRITE